MIATGHAKHGNEIELEKDPIGIGHLRQVYIAMSKETENDLQAKGLKANSSIN
jgi:hypothetical protein